ncbi:hypothetical protein [Nannocystis pusilla]|uniref:hypothetical protein n=1 Tax=Nannocystis pusilla TaxID=889268 RepID=UPI003B7EA878
MRRPFFASPFFIDGEVRTLPRWPALPPAPGSSPSVLRSATLPRWTSGAPSCIAAAVSTTNGSVL